MLSLVHSETFSKPLKLLGDDFPPFHYMNNDEISGISVEILQTILSELQYPHTIEVIPWARAYNKTLNQQNAVLTNAVRTDERESLFKWVGPIAPRSIVIYKLKKRNDIIVNSLEDAKKYTVGTIRGYAAEKTLISQGFTIGINLKPVTKKHSKYKKDLC